MRDDDPTRNDASECECAACDLCGLHSNDVGDVDRRLMCGRCFNAEADRLADRMTLRKRARRRAVAKRARPIECPHWDYENPDPDCECVGGAS